MHTGHFASTCQEMRQCHLSGWCQMAVLVTTQVKNCSGARMTAVCCHSSHVTDNQFVFGLENGIVGHFLLLGSARFMNK